MNTQTNEQLLGKVTLEESQELEKAFKRKNALERLFFTLTEQNLSETNELYERVVSDMSDTLEIIKKWWTTVSKKYNWSYGIRQSWRIDFDTQEIYLFS